VPYGTRRFGIQLINGATAHHSAALFWWIQHLRQACSPHRSSGGATSATTAGSNSDGILITATASTAATWHYPLAPYRRRVRHVIQNNDILDFYFYGIYISYMPTAVRGIA
jgi:hypothetical protein